VKVTGRLQRGYRPITVNSVISLADRTFFSHVLNFLVFTERWSCYAERGYSLTRKLSYRKDNRAMRPMLGCPENFRQSMIAVVKLDWHFVDSSYTKFQWKFQKGAIEIFLKNSWNLWNFQSWKFHPTSLVHTVSAVDSQSQTNLRQTDGRTTYCGITALRMTITSRSIIRRQLPVDSSTSMHTAHLHSGSGFLDFSILARFLPYCLLIYASWRHCTWFLVVCL